MRPVRPIDFIAASLPDSDAGVFALSGSWKARQRITRAKITVKRQSKRDPICAYCSRLIVCRSCGQNRTVVSPESAAASPSEPFAKRALQSGSPATIESCGAVSFSPMWRCIASRATASSASGKPIHNRISSIDCLDVRLAWARTISIHPM